MRGKSSAPWMAVLLALAVWASGVQRTAPSGEWVIRDSPWLRVTPRLLEPGVHFLFPCLFRTYRYPAYPVGWEFLLGGPEDPAPAPVSLEGASLEVEGEIVSEIDPRRLMRLHREVGTDYGRLLLDPVIRSHLQEILRTAPLAGTPEAKDGVALRLARDLKAPLGEFGIRLVSLRIDRLEPVRRIASGLLPGRQDPGLAGSRVLLVGWDGADWNIIDPLLEEGRMPHLAGLIRKGTRSRIKTINPILSPVVWTSIATGMTPERHGIVDFVATDASTGAQVPVTSNLRRTDALWNLVSEAGLPVGVTGWWATWPAEPVRGFMVSDRVSSQFTGFQGIPASEPEGKVYPPSLWPLVQKEILPPARIRPRDLAPFLDPDRLGELPEKGKGEELVEGLRAALASTRTYAAVARRLAERHHPSFEAVYFQGIDRVSHLFMQYRPPRMPGILPEEVEILGRVVDRFYEYQDGILGRFLERAGPDTTVIVCSDHGFRTGLHRPRTDPRIGHGRAADWHRKFGILVLAGKPVQSGHALSQASVLDLAPTILTLLGLPVPTDLEGRVLVEAFRPEFLRDHPVRYIAPPEADLAAGPEPRPLPSPEDEAIRKNLLALGYLSQESMNARNNLGILHLTHGRFDEAIREFEKALQEDPNFLIVRINLGRAYLLKGDRERARAILRRAAMADPTVKETWNLLGNMTMEDGELEVAERYFRKAISLDPNDTDSRNSLGLLYDRMGRWEEAIQQYRYITEVDPDFEKAYNNMGVIYQRSGRLDEARAMFERAVRADPDFPGSYNNLGIVLQDLGDLRAAEQVFLQGLARSPSHPVLRNSLGGVYFRLGRLQEARRQFELSLQVDPAYESAHNNLGAVLGSLGDPEGQMKEYRRAIEIRGDYTDARYNLALAYLAAGREPEGLRELEKTLEIAPDHLAALLRLAAERLRRGELSQAQAHLVRARELHPDQPAPCNLLAQVLLLQGGREEEARKLWEESLRLDPDQPAIRSRLRGGPAGGEGSGGEAPAGGKP